MSGPAPTFKGWYPDPAGGGTRYWDGERWSGDTRPRRRPFAPAHSFGSMGYLLVFVAVMWLFLAIMAFGETRNGGYIFGGICFLVASLVALVYLRRGQGPSTAEVEARLAAQRKEARSKRRSANVAAFAASLGGGVKSGSRIPPHPDSRATAQINAISNPQTAQALQNLQHLLFTQAITDQEFDAAKEKLLGPVLPSDAFTYIEKLAELHRAGILGDVEFSAAKAKALGL